MTVTDPRQEILAALANLGGEAHIAHLHRELGHRPDPHCLAGLQTPLPNHAARALQPRPGFYRLTAAGLRELARGVNLAAALVPADRDTVGPAGPGHDDLDSYPSIAVAGAMAFLYVDQPGVLVLSLHLDTGDVPGWLTRADGCVPVRVTVNGDEVFTDARPALALADQAASGAAETAPADSVGPGATAAERAFAALDTRRRAQLARGVFEILEYDQDGERGSRWSSDTTQYLGELFAAFGIVFSNPDEVDGQIVAAGTGDTTKTASPADPLVWAAGDGDQVVTAASSARFRLAGVAAQYRVAGGDGRWNAALVVTDCGNEVAEAGTALGEFTSDAAARDAAQRHETALL
jgi:hypothetical protein